jgi:hypothetical protein
MFKKSPLPLQIVFPHPQKMSNYTVPGAVPASSQYVPHVPNVFPQHVYLYTLCICAFVDRQ